MLSSKPIRILSALLAFTLMLGAWTFAEESAPVEAAPEEIEVELSDPSCETVACEEETPTEAPQAAEAAPEAVLPEALKPVLPESITMGVDQKLSLSEAYGLTGCKYQSGNPKVAPVNETTGEITAKKRGDAVITVTTPAGASVTTTVTVLKKPTSIELKVDEATLGMGETCQLQVVLPKKTGGGVTFASSDPAVASVDAAGRVTAAGLGEAKITARLYTGKTATFAARVKNAPTSADMQLSLDHAVVGVGEIVEIPVSYANDCGGTVSYTVDSDSVLLDPEGARIKGAKAGTAVVTATAYNGAQVSATVQVQVAPTRVVVENPPAKLGVGDTWQLGVQLYADKELCDGGYTFKSSKSTVLAVDENGMLTALKAGTARITVTAYNKKKTTIKVKVFKQPTSIALTPKTMKLAVGKTGTLKVTLSKKSYAAVTFSSSNESVAAVSAAGVVKGVANGTATITARTASGLSAQCEVTVGTGEAGDDIETDPKDWRDQVIAPDWYKGGSDILKKGEYGYIYDIKTGIVVKIKRMGGHEHADVEPATKEDTKKLLRVAGGEFDWASHGVILHAGGKYVACAINTMPHGDQTIHDNDYDGQFCLHMVNSKTHGTGKINVEHQAAIKAAYNWAHGK